MLQFTVRISSTKLRFVFILVKHYRFLQSSGTRSKQIDGRDYKKRCHRHIPVYDYMANYLFGGLGSFLGRSADFASKVTQSDQPAPTLNDIPIVRRFVGDKTTYYDAKRFYNLVNHTSVKAHRTLQKKRNPSRSSSDYTI